jgi:hypothetical protein
LIIVRTCHVIDYC